MVLHCQILFSLAIAEAILMWISAEQGPCLHKVAPRYLKLVTSSNFWLFMLIPAPMLFMLLVMILLFSVLTSTPYAIVLSTSLLMWSWSSPWLSSIRWMVSANSRLCMGLPPMEMNVWWSWSVSYITFSRNKLNWIGESKHPWWTPIVVLKNFSRGLHCCVLI